jgi:hypothetical protein
MLNNNYIILTAAKTVPVLTLSLVANLNKMFKTIAAGRASFEASPRCLKQKRGLTWPTSL